jgi:hypothetical protein
VKSTAIIKTTDLSQALDYLDGLAVMLNYLHAARVGHKEPSTLRDRLDELDTNDAHWAPLRHQPGDGEGWLLVAANVNALRDRLLEGFVQPHLRS